MSSQNSTAGPTSTTGPAVTLEKASDIQNIHHHHLTGGVDSHTHQPMDLAPRGPSVVQLRPLRPVFSTLPHGTTLAKTQVGQTIATAVAAGTPIISVNRTPQANLTLLPARGPGGPGQGGPQQGIPTYQITRVGGSVRAGGQQPASITVTPITSNIRLTAATVNNGAWIQGTQAAFTTTPIRAATITVGGRPVRPDGKIIHIPQQGSIQHVAQLHMVDGKGSFIKQQMPTPIVNIRGTLPGGANQGGGPVTLPISPFTIRTANITSLPTLHQRPQLSNTTANQVHKVITSGHGAPIQFVNANKNPHVIQAITPIPRLSTVSLLLSTNAPLAPNNSSPVVAVASRHAGGGPSLIMTPSTFGGAIPITKVYPMGREIVDTIFAAPNSSTSANAVTVSTVNVNATSSQGIHATPTSVVVATPHSAAHGQSHHPQHVVVHTPTINVHAANASVGLPPPNLAPGSMAPYYVEKNFSVNLVQAHQAQTRPISFEKKMDSKGPPPGSMIFTTTHPHLHQGTGGHGATVTIPIAPHGTQHLNISHTIPISHQAGHNHHSMQAGSTQILTHIPTGQHHFTSSMLTAVSTPSITVTGPTNYQGQSLSAVSTQGYSIPTHVISQSVGAPTSNPISTQSVTTTTIISTNISNTNTTTVSNSTSNPTSTSGSTTSTSAAPTVAATNSSSSNTLSTAPPAQSPNQTKSTHSPRPSILRKRDESHLSTRAQRNLTHSLNFAVNNSNTGASASASAAAAAANKENSMSIEKIPTTSSSCGSSSGVSILKKEFQPPTEESSWQSVSSNSSSGSSTISTTSETAELQMQQQQLSVVGQGLVDLSSVNLSTHNIYLYEPPTNTSLGTPGAGAPVTGALGVPGTSSSQNGVVRSTSTAGQGRSRTSSTSKGMSKDLERVKSKDKEDAVSPRKKPRKQQLTSSELLESASPEIYYHGKGKKFRKSEQVDFSEGFVEKLGIEPIPEEPPPPKVVYYIKKPHMSLMQTNQILPKTTNSTHFQRYCDVKPKDDRRPTISDLANQKNVYQKVSGWRLQHMTSQMDQVIDGESGVVNKFTNLLSRLEAKVGPNCQDRDLNMVVELLKGNIQRCKVIRDQMSESRALALKVLEHKEGISGVIRKYTNKSTESSSNATNNSKRPAKKRDRL